MTDNIRHHLGIDFGDENIGVALVRWDGERNHVLYATTLTVIPRALKELFTPRAGLRRVRRTAQSKRRRMKRLRSALASSGLSKADVERVVTFCRRRGFSWDPGEEAENGGELPYSVHRTEFFSALEAFLGESLDDPGQEREALRLCRSILDAEIRPMRFLNRSVSRCGWEGCGKNVPKAKNAVDLRLTQAIFGQLRPAFNLPEEYRLDPAPFEEFIRDAGKTGEGVRDDLKDRLKALTKHLKDWARSVVEPSDVLRREYDLSKTRVDNIWKYLRKQLRDIISETPGGRVSFCRPHSEAFAVAVLAGRVAPRDETVTEADLRFRRQQVVFGKLWRFIEVRLLPLAGGRIDRITVERNAFDLIRVQQVRIHEGMDEGAVDRAQAKRRRLGRQAAEVYWYGPQYGFDGEREMLLAEFGGLCAYCGKSVKKRTMEREHVLNEADFPLNGYLNMVPACQGCNKKKGARTALAAGMSINDNAYEAYGDYIKEVKKTRPVHPFMTVKKGILNLLLADAPFWKRCVSRPDDGERILLDILGQNLVTATRTMQAPRPLSRYLAGKLEAATCLRPKIEAMNGRHTAMIREEMIPDFSKPTNREEEGEARLANHAIDAIVLAGQWPSTTALESRHIRGVDINSWRRGVRERRPDVNTDGKLSAPLAVSNLEGFEEVTPYGTYTTGLLMTNWSRRDKARFDASFYGQWRGRPTRRIPATRVVENLRNTGGGRKMQDALERIVHPGLRKTLLDAWGSSDDVGAVETALVKWLQQSTRRGIEDRPEPTNPASRARWKELRDFCDDSGRDPLQIPAVVGIRCVDLGARGYEMVERVLEGRTIHRLKPTANVREKIVAYGAGDDGLPDRTKYVLLDVHQNSRLKPSGAQVASLPPVPEDSPLAGRKLGDGKKLVDHRREWEAALKSYLSGAGLVEWHRLTQGCVIEHEDGSHRFVRNFKTGVGFKTGWCRGIMRVYRSPYSYWNA
jgi:5-methylcytosine-specific restriction endonuclease McrA